ncbi:hypothetical protein [Dethiothermospora halolimnae]|uniref:hypothetical protein n=1 Tax=Dethiothermospora halolimnae TaxID=3114390 RepID=UPI003CCC0D5C
MTDKEMLIEYINKFRLNCHYRFNFMPPEIDGIPFYLYEKAHKEAKEEMIKEGIAEDKINIIEDTYNLFIDTMKEKQDYSLAEKTVLNSINS